MYFITDIDSFYFLHKRVFHCVCIYNVMKIPRNGKLFLKAETFGEFPDMAANKKYAVNGQYNADCNADRQ